MYTFLSPAGEIIKTKTIADFARTYGFRYSNAKSLACGIIARLNGWCSTHPRAKQHRKRFLTVLIHPQTGQRKILGQTVTRFAKEHGLCVSELYKLINGRKMVYRGWMLERTHELAHSPVAVEYF